MIQTGKSLQGVIDSYVVSRNGMPLHKQLHDEIMEMLNGLPPFDKEDGELIAAALDALQPSLLALTLSRPQSLAIEQRINQIKATLRKEML